MNADELQDEETTIITTEKNSLKSAIMSPDKT